MAVPIPLGYLRSRSASGNRMDVVLQSRTSKYGIGRIHPKTAAGHGCITLLLLSTVKNGGITVQHRAPPQRHQVRDPGATPLRTGGVVAAGASTGLRGRQAGHAPALERTSDARLATRHRGLAQPRKGEHSRTAKFRACSLKKTDIFFDKHRKRASGRPSTYFTTAIIARKPALKLLRGRICAAAGCCTGAWSPLGQA